MQPLMAPAEAWKASGLPEVSQSTLEQAEERFHRYTERSELGCWPWSRHRDTYGYGRFVIGGQKYRTHRLAWVFAGRVIPSELLVCHHCDSPPCVRPSHLFVGSHADNSRDMIQKGRARHLAGDLHPNAKLTWDAVRFIRQRAADGERYAVLAEQHGVAMSTVGMILNGTNWKETT